MLGTLETASTESSCGMTHTNFLLQASKMKPFSRSAGKIKAGLL